MKNLIFKSRFLILFVGLLTMCVTPVWGAEQIIEITPSYFPSSYSTSEKTCTLTVGGQQYVFGFKNIMYNGKNSPSGLGAKSVMQCKSNASDYGRIYNKTEIPGIQKITYYWYSGGKTFETYVGSEASITSTPSSGNLSIPSSASGSYTFAYTDNNGASKSKSVDFYDIDVSKSSPSYFYMTIGNTSTTYLTKIVITFDPEAGETCTAPGTALSITSAATATVGAPMSLTTTGGNGGTVTWSVTNGTGSATVDGSTLNPVTAGTVTVKAHQDQNGATCEQDAEKVVTISKQATTITLSEAGNESNVSGTHYVGDSYDLPTTTEATCGDKVFVGWSTVQIPTAGAKPVSNYYEKGASVTLGATNKFYAVFATASGGAESTWSITPSNLDKPGSGSGYAPYNGSHTLDGYSYTSNQVMVQSSLVQFQTTNGYIYNTTSFGSITKIVVTGTNSLSVFDCATSTTSKPSSGAISATGSGPYTFTFSGDNGFFFINANGSTPKASEIKVYYGGSTYTDYLTECSEPVKYYVAGLGLDWEEANWNEMTVVDGVASVTVDLPVSTAKEFKIVEKDGDTKTWYGNAGAIITDISGWDYTDGGANTGLYTGPAGEYTFSFNTSTHKVAVTYPSVSHPAAGYAYFQKQDSWSGFKVYNYTNGDNQLTNWAGSPTVTNSTTICGTVYYYTALATKFDKVIFRDNGSNQWKDIAVSGFSGKYCGDDYSANPQVWKEFSTYTITFAGGTGATGSMEAIGNIACGSSKVIPANGFSKTGHRFAGWKDQDENSYAAGATIASVTKNLTLTAQWEVESYTLTWNLDGGRITTAGTGAGPVAYGTTLVAPTVEKDGYNFVAWTPAVAATMPAEAATYTATWTAKNYTITLDSKREGNNADNAGTTSVTATFDANTNLTGAITKPTMTGYKFGGYWTVAGGTGTQIIDEDGNFIADVANYTDASKNWKNAADVTLYAKWLESFTVTWMYNNNTHTTTQVVQGDGLVLPTVADPDPSDDCGTGYVFMGWTKAESVNANGAGIVYAQAGDAVTESCIYRAVIALKTGEVSDDYVITTTSPLTSGDYVIGYQYNTGAKIVMSNVDKANEHTQLTAIAKDPSGSPLKYTKDVDYINNNRIWTITKHATENTYSIKNKENGLYVNMTTTAVTLGSTPQYFIFTWDNTNSRWTIQHATSTTYYLHGYVSGSSYDFRVSTSGNGERYKISLFKSASSATYSDYKLVCATAYPIRVTPPSNGSIDVDGGRTSAPEDAVVTITATPNTRYIFNGWTVTGAKSTGDLNLATTTFTMGTEEVTVAASFRPAMQKTVEFYVGGTLHSTEQIYENEDVALPTGIESTDDDYVTFLGWSETEFTDLASATVLTEDQTITDDKNYYAVFTNERISHVIAAGSAGDNVLVTKTSYEDGVKTKTAGGVEYKYYKVLSSNVSGTYYLQFQKSAADYGYVYNTTSLGNIQKVVVGAVDVPVYACTSAGTTTGSAIEKTGTEPRTYTMPDNTGYFMIKGDNNSTYKPSYFDVYYVPSGSKKYTTNFCTKHTVTMNSPLGATLSADKTSVCAGKTVTITAVEKPGSSFTRWTTSSEGVSFANATSLSTTFTMPDHDVTISAETSAVLMTAMTLNQTNVVWSEWKSDVALSQQLSVASTTPAEVADNTVTWSVSSGTAVAVSATGLVTPLAAGTATVTATANDGSGVTASCTFTVPEEQWVLNLSTVTGLELYTNNDSRRTAKKQYFTAGTVVNIGATENGGYAFTGWNITGATPAANTKTTTITMPAGVVTIDATSEEKVDRFIDEMHGYSEKTGRGANYTIPSMSDKNTGGNDCENAHYKFVGWLAEDNVNADGTPKVTKGDPATPIPAGGTQNATGKTYIAVWAEED